VASNRPSTGIGQLLRTVCAPSAEPQTDGQLLGQFLARRDEAAFVVLVRRHGPMVLGVCRRVLGNAHDAEDAFQATFLVLVRKAAALTGRAVLGDWLHGVARHTALNARRAAARRRAKERSMAEREVQGEEVRDDWLPLLDEELARLPQKYRQPIVLCDLKGKAHHEASRALGLPLGTLSGRLSRARAMLARRLARRGLALSAGALAAPLSASAGVPAGLVTATVEAAGLLAAGRAAGMISAQVIALTEGVVKTMLLRKLKTATAVLLVLGAAALGYATMAGGPAKGKAPVEVKPLPAREAKQADPDSDGDGLSDFHEVHKYRTSPRKKDTAGTGAPDGGWQQRREFTYSVRAVVRVMPPYNLEALTDDYQDVRVLAKKKDCAELEVVVYPLNSNAEAIKGNPNWKKDYAGMKEYLAPGVTTNWDETMRKEILRELAKDGINPDKLTDKEVVERVSRWLFQRCRHRSTFCTFYVGFPGGKPAVLPGLEKAFERDRGDKNWTVRQQFDHELFGKEMFTNRTVGTCTSAAVLQTTVLRALGIPTRMVLAIPLADASDPAQVAMVEKGLTHRRVRRDVFLALSSLGSSFTSHTFCEVFVAGRWRRLNYAKLGQNVLDTNCLGLMIHVHTFRDLSEANLAQTWGARYAGGHRDGVFKHSNPYRLMEVSDHFGKHARVPNPPVPELRRVTIGKAYWFGSKDVPKSMPSQFKERPTDGSGRLVLHCEEWLEDAGNYLQYKVFLLKADPELVLKAKGRPDVRAHVEGSYYTAPAEGLHEVVVVIPARELAKMAKGAKYTIHPVNGKKGPVWRVRDGVTVTRE
jgi:RNA polymerase sigma factor (sigma-70 family)